MKVCETIQQSLQHVKTSLGTAADKTSATVKKASQIALTILKVLFTPITYLCTRAKSFFEKRREKPTESPEASAQVRNSANLHPAQDSDSTEDETGSAIRRIFEESDRVGGSVQGESSASHPHAQDSDSTEDEIGSAIRRIFEESDRVGGSVQGESSASLPHAQYSDSTEDEIGSAIRSIFAEESNQVGGSVQGESSASPLSDQDGDSKKKAAVKIQKLFRGHTGRKAYRAQSVKAVATAVVGEMVAAESTQNERPATNYPPFEQQVFENLKAQILGTKDNFLMSNLARRAHFEQKHEAITVVLNHNAQAKAKANSAAIAFVKNIVDLTALQYVPGAKISHKVPAATGAPREVIRFSQAWKVGDLSSFFQGGSAAEWPLPTSAREKKSLKRRSHAENALDS
jgi:hypothetical protein